jgi:hypothetical protein
MSAEWRTDGARIRVTSITATGVGLDTAPPIEEGRLDVVDPPAAYSEGEVALMALKPRTRLFTVLVAILLVSSIGAATAKASPPYQVSVTPAKAIAGSSASVLTFQFSAVNAARGWNTVQVPAVASGSAWSAPQSSNPADPGFVAVSSQTCSSASLSSIMGPAGGPWTILVNATCAKNARFAIRYGSGPSPVKVPTKVGSYVFTATRVVAQPVVNVTAARASQLDVTGLVDGEAGSGQSATVTLRDQFGNVASRYRGTVHLDADGWGFPGGNEHAFTAGDAGVHAFDVTPFPAGEQKLAATDTVNSTLTGSQTITISPGPTARIDTHFTNFGDTALVLGQTVRFGAVVSALDAYGNITPWNHTVEVLAENPTVPTILLDQDVTLETGQKTLEVPVPIDAATVRLSIFLSLSGLDPNNEFGNLSLTGGLLLTQAVQPDLTLIHVEFQPPNPDGSANNYISLDYQGSPITVSPPQTAFDFTQAVKNADGTTSVPFTTKTPGGAEIVGVAVMTTPASPQTGLVLGTDIGDLAAAAAKISVMSCDQLQQEFKDLQPASGSLPPAPPCPSSFAPTGSVPPDTAWIVFDPSSPQSQAAALVSVIDVRCKDITKTYNAATDKCE